MVKSMKRAPRLLCGGVSCSSPKYSGQSDKVLLILPLMKVMMAWDGRAWP